MEPGHTFGPGDHYIYEPRVSSMNIYGANMSLGTLEPIYVIGKYAQNIGPLIFGPCIDGGVVHFCYGCLGTPYIVRTSEPAGPTVSVFETCSRRWPAFVAGYLTVHTRREPCQISGNRPLPGRVTSDRFLSLLPPSVTFFLTVSS